MSSKITGTYNDCKKKLVFPRTIMYTQNTMAIKSKRIARQVLKKSGADRTRKRSEKENRIAGNIHDSATLGISVTS